MQKGRNERILAHYILTHKNGNFLEIGKGGNIDIEEPSLDYIKEWSMYGDNMEKYWSDDKITSIDFLPILEEREKDKYIQMERIDSRTYKIFLRPKFKTLPYVNEPETIGVSHSPNIIKFSDIEIDTNKKKFEINGKTIDNFEELKRMFKIPINKYSEFKAGIACIYTISRYLITYGDGPVIMNRENISYMIKYYNSFKEDFKNNRPFESRGISKKTISKKDCDYANNILRKCNSETRFARSREKITVN